MQWGGAALAPGHLQLCHASSTGGTSGQRQGTSAWAGAAGGQGEAVAGSQGCADARAPCLDLG